MIRSSMVAACALVLTAARAGDERYPVYAVLAGGPRAAAGQPAGAVLPAPLPATEAGPTIYVDDDAPPGGNGQSWSTAFRHLQDALAAAAGAPASIRVAQGLQRPDQDEGGLVVAGDRAATFALTQGLQLIGGFAGIGAPDPDARDPDLYVSRLDGDLLGNDGPDFAGNAENSRHVVTAANGGGSSMLAGFRISAGRAELPVEYEGSGAGILCPATSGTTVVFHCTLTGNFAYGYGAGLYAHTGSKVNVQDCTITGNRSDPLYGPGITCYGASMTVTGTTFADNHATEAGGALFVYGGSAVLTGCTFTGNRADAAQSSLGGGAVSILISAEFSATDCTWQGNSTHMGGGAIDFSSSGSLSLAGGVFADNVADDAGGAITGFDNDGVDLSDLLFTHNVSGVSGGGLALDLVQFDVGLHDCVFVENQAFDGGGAWLRLSYGGDLLAEGCRFAGNTATQSMGGFSAWPVKSAVLRDTVIEDNHCGGFGGGLVLSSDTTALMERCRIERNSAVLSVGGMEDLSDELVMVNCLVADNHAGTHSGGVHLWTSVTAQLVNCTLAGNTALTDGGGLRLFGNPAVSLENCIAWGNSAPLGAQLSFGTEDLPGSLYVARSDVQGGAAGVWKPVTGQKLFWVPDNLDADPLFVDAADRHLLHGSPCLDNADGAVEFAPSDDWEGDPRPTGAGPDRGADEFAARLYITGTLEPGGAIAVKLLGEPGALVQGLFVGFGLLPAPLTGQFGAWYLEPPTLPLVLFLPLSSGGALELPATLPLAPPGPYAVYLQALVAGQLGNVATLAVE